MARLVREVVEKLRRQLAAAQRWEVTILDASANDTQDELSLRYELTPSIEAGAILSINDEDVYVLEVDTSTYVVTVIRGWNGSDAGHHDVNDVVWIEPRWTGADLADTLRDEILSWPTKLFRVFGATVDVASDDETVELATTFTGLYGIIDVRFNETAADTTAWKRADVRLQRGYSTTWEGAATSGVLLRYKRGVLPAGSLYVEAAMPFDIDAWDWEADLVDDIGIPESCIDLATLGVKVRLLADSEIGRSARDAQGDARNAQETPPGAAIGAAEALRQLYMRRMAEEVARLAARYPIVVG